MKLSALIQGLPLQVLRDGDVEILGIATDSRAVKPGDLFMARTGWFVDSHTFIAAAIQAGAVACVVTKTEDLPDTGGLPLLFSSHEDRDLGLLAARFYGNPCQSLRVIGITGTNGKTSCTYVVESLLLSQGCKAGVIGTVNNRFDGQVFATRNTTPDGLTIHRFAEHIRQGGGDTLIMEVSSHGASCQRIAGVTFDAAGFTNLSPEHLDFHHDMEAYASAKALLFGEGLRASAAAGKSPKAVLWGHDHWAERMAQAASGHAQVFYVGPEGQDLQVRVLEERGVDGSLVELRGFGEEARGLVPLVGPHNVANVALSVALVRVCGIGTLPSLLAGLADFDGIPGRMERVASAGYEPAVFVDYAHTADAITQLGAAMSGAGMQGTTLVVGAGGDRDPSKRAPMAAAALEAADQVILTSDNPRSEEPAAILEAMLEGIPVDARKDVKIIQDRSQAISEAIHMAKGPVVIAGKGHETTQSIGGRGYHFDDREEARRQLWALRSGQAPGQVPLLSGWSAERVAQASGGTLIQRGARQPWGLLQTDSRQVQPGDIFLAIRGQNFDGNRFITTSIQQGAALVMGQLLPDNLPKDVAAIRIDDAERALAGLSRAILAEARARHGGLRTFGITGSNGKTTTKNILQALLGDATHATPGNFNNQIGLPLTVSRLADSHRSAILEMGASKPGDIAELVQMAQPEIGLITSIGLAHIQGFGDLQGVRSTKAEIADAGLEVLVLPATEREEPQWQEAIRRAGRVLTVSSVDASEVDSDAANKGADGTWSRRAAPGLVRVTVAGQSVELEFPLPGAHNATNLATAIAAWFASTGALPPEEALARVAAMAPATGRLEPLDVGGRQLLNDAYNANPSSMRASLSVLADAGTYRVAVLAGMHELGPDSATMHRELGAVAALSADLVVVVGETARPIAQGAAARGHYFESPAAAAEFLAGAVPRGATLLLKGSRREGLETMIPLLRDTWEARE